MDYFSSKTMDGVINSNGLPSPTKRTQREYKGSIFFFGVTHDVWWCAGPGNMDKVGAKHFVGGHVLDFFGFGYEIC